MKKGMLVGLLVALGLLAACGAPAPVGTPTAAVKKGPRIAVDKELQDFGRVAYNQEVSATFTVSNVGDAPLVMQKEVPLQVVEGC